MNRTLLALALFAPALPAFCSPAAAQWCLTYKPTTCCAVEFTNGLPFVSCDCDGDFIRCDVVVLSDPAIYMTYSAGGEQGWTHFSLQSQPVDCVLMYAVCGPCLCLYLDNNLIVRQCTGVQVPVGAPNCNLPPNP